MIWFKLKKLLRILLNHYYIIALFKGTSAGVEHINILKDYTFSFITDVGANRGQFAIVARSVFPNAIIHSFEPLEEPARIFRKIFKKDKKVILHAHALGFEKNILTIHMTKDDDSSSLMKVTEQQSDLFPGSKEIGDRDVEVHSLSEVFEGIKIHPEALLKIDVQGYELEVLKGSGEVLSKFSHLYIESSYIELYEGQPLAHEIISWLSEKGFSLIGPYNTQYNKKGKPIQSDLMFSKNIRACK